MPKPLSELQNIAKRDPPRDHRDDRGRQIRPSGRIAFGSRDRGGAVLRLDAASTRNIPRSRTATALFCPRDMPRRCCTAAMAEAGYAETPLDQLNTLRKLGSVYQGHPDVRYIHVARGVDRVAGRRVSRSASAWALADRLDGRPNRTYVMIGDGESQEGQIWEAAMSGAFHKIDNVVAIVDYNGIQLDGFVKDIMDVAPLADKWRAFGWNTIEIDGHDFARDPQGLEQADATKGKPTALSRTRSKGRACPSWRTTRSSTAPRRPRTK